jgi:hypothetical protein
MWDSYFIFITEPYLDTGNLRILIPLQISGKMSNNIFHRNYSKIIILRDEGTEVCVNSNNFNVSLCYEMKLLLIHFPKCPEMNPAYEISEKEIYFLLLVKLHYNHTVVYMSKIALTICCSPLSTVIRTA